MKAMLFGLAFTGSAMVLGALVAVDATALLAVQGVGADTPIEGVTIGVLVLLVIAAAGILWRGAKTLIDFGGQLKEWKDALDGAAKLGPIVNQCMERLERLERWRREVDPISIGPEAAARGHGSQGTTPQSGDRSA